MFNRKPGRKKDPESATISRAIGYLRAAEREINKVSPAHHHKLAYAQTCEQINKAIDWADDLRYVVKMERAEKEGES